MRIETVKITPAMAREWLAVDPTRHTRALRARTIAKIARAIEAGEWRLTHQPIALDPVGFVLDGRHRLTAIAGQRKHVTALVAYDADPDTYNVIDTGAARSPGDSLRVAGYTDVNVLAATARQVRAYPDTIGTASTIGSIGRDYTTAEIMDTLDDPEIGKRIQDAIAPGNRIAQQIGRNGYRSSATVLVALIRIYSTHGADTQEEYLERFATGVGLEADSPILGFRRWIIQDTGYVRVAPAYRQTAALAVGIRAWNDYAAGNPRYAIRYRSGVDTMPEID